MSSVLAIDGLTNGTVADVMPTIENWSAKASPKESSIQRTTKVEVVTAATATARSKHKRNKKTKTLLFVGQSV